MPGGVVLIVGSANVDLVVRTARLPTPGETVTGGRFARYSGGKGANQAVAAARMGARVHFVGAVGQDELGSVAIADLESEGVGVAGVARLADLSTGVALIVVADDGENQIAVAPGANAALNGPSVESAIAALELAVGDVFLANLEVTDEAILAGARAAARARLQLLINPAPARALPDELLKLAPILLPNEVEAEALTGERDPVEAARALGGRTGAPVIVTLGAAGAVLVTGDGVERLPARQVEVVDTTGAGDTFAGALAATLASGSTLPEAARVAMRAASISVTAAGARAGMPTKTQVDGA